MKKPSDYTWEEHQAIFAFQMRFFGKRIMWPVAKVAFLSLVVTIAIVVSIDTAHPVGYSVFFLLAHIGVLIVLNSAFLDCYREHVITSQTWKRGGAVYVLRKCDRKIVLYQFRKDNLIERGLDEDDERVLRVSAKLRHYEQQKNKALFFLGCVPQKPSP